MAHGWIDRNNRKLATLTARQKNNAVVMEGKNALGREVRNTFFNIEYSEFYWKQEWTFDGGSDWITVTKIHCVRKEESKS